MGVIDTVYNIGDKLDCSCSIGSPAGSLFCCVVGFFCCMDGTRTLDAPVPRLAVELFTSKFLLLFAVAVSNIVLAVAVGILVSATPAFSTGWRLWFWLLQVNITFVSGAI